MTIVMYRIKDREVANRKTMEAKSILDAHVFHANDNDNKVLFTTPLKASNVEKKPERDNLKQIILALSENIQYIGEIHEMGKLNGKNSRRYLDYEVPSQWKNRLENDEFKKNYAWYEIENIRELIPSERDLLVSNGYDVEEDFLATFKNHSRYRGPVYLKWRNTNASN